MSQDLSRYSAQQPGNSCAPTSHGLMTVSKRLGILNDIKNQFHQLMEILMILDMI